MQRIIWTPGSIISLFNEPFTVLDVPRLAFKGEVYGYQKPNPSHLFSAGQLLAIEFKPEHTNKTLRVLDLNLAIAPNKKSEGAFPTNMTFSLQDSTRKQMHLGNRLEDMITAIDEYIGQNKDIYIRLYLHHELPLQSLQNLYALLETMEGENKVRIEPPLQGNLYFKAFLPDQTYRDPSKRPGQPWELHLYRKKGNVEGFLRETKQTWSENNRPIFTTRDIPISNPQESAKVMAENKNRLHVLLIFIHNKPVYRELKKFVSDVIDLDYTVYVFFD